MKRSLFPLIGVAIFLTLVFSANTITAQDSVVNARLALLSKRIDSLGEKKDEQIVTVIALNKDSIRVEGKDVVTNNYRSAGKVKVDTITFSIKDGYVIDVNVYCGKKIFTNTQAPIALTPLRIDKKVDKLYNIERSTENEGIAEGTERISFQSVIIPKLLTTFAAEDGNYGIGPVKDSILRLIRQVGINTVLDLRLYTDALGLFGNSANGLVQTDAKIKYFFHHRNWWNNSLSLFQYAKLDFNASKFDSKQSYADSSSFSRTALMQKAFLNAQFSLNIVNGWLEFKSPSRWYVDGGLGFYQSRLAGLKDTTSVTTPDWFFEAGIDLFQSDNIGGNLYIRMIDQYSPQTLLDKYGKLFWKFNAEIFWNPFENKANRLFARANYTVSSNAEDQKNHFVQFQLGYSVLLSSLIKK